jgi:hypothetical protein
MDSFSIRHNYGYEVTYKQIYIYTISSSSYGIHCQFSSSSYVTYKQIYIRKEYEYSEVISDR